MQIKVRPLLKGIATYVVPSLYKVQFRGIRADRDLARYSYSVWLRHLCFASDYGLPTKFDVVAELGPGNSLGLGACALLSGATKYYALDVVRHVDDRASAKIFLGVFDLFRKRADIPGEDEFPDLYPKLSSYAFPHHIFPRAYLDSLLVEGRVNKIREVCTTPDLPPRDGIEARYFTPWDDANVVKESTVDFLCSQFVLEHVDDVFATYQSMRKWLKPGGCMSHFIDFKSHAMTRNWNGHWACSDRMWRLMRGKRPYMLNREPHSAHLRAIRECGLRTVCDVPVRDSSGIGRESLTPRYRSYLNDEDIFVRGVLVQAIKERGSTSQQLSPTSSVMSSAGGERYCTQGEVGR